jgi:hypothetical protein
MIEKSLWIKNIYMPISEIADANYQHRAWILGEVHDYCSFQDTICRLYEDACFEDFLDNQIVNWNFPPDLVAKLRKFKKNLDHYVDENSTWIEEIKVINDPEWHKISLAAKELVEDFQRLHLV